MADITSPEMGTFQSNIVTYTPDELMELVSLIKQSNSIFWGTEPLTEKDQEERARKFDELHARQESIKQIALTRTIASFNGDIEKLFDIISEQIPGVVKLFYEMLPDTEQAEPAADFPLTTMFSDGYLREYLHDYYWDYLALFMAKSNAHYGKLCNLIDLCVANKKEIVSKRNVSARSLAQSQGAITSLDGFLSSFSLDELEKAFTSFSLARLPEDEEISNNELHITDLSRLSHMDDIDVAPLAMVLRTVIKTYNKDIDPTSDNTSVRIYLPALCKQLNIDVRGYSKDRTELSQEDYARLRHDAFLKKLLPFDRVIGRLPNGSYYRVLAVSSYDAESETLVLNTPYMFKALELAMEEKEKNDKLVFVNNLFLPTVFKEHNHAAVEIASYITTQLLKRGTTNPTEDEKTGKKYIKYEIRYSTIIEKCPQIKGALETIERQDTNVRQKKNAKLKQTFEAAFRIIKEKTRASEYFEDFSLNAPTPTASTLNMKMTITFTKINKDK